MLIYLEKEFIKQFEADQFRPDNYEFPGHRRLYELFKNYPDLEIYSDMEESEHSLSRTLMMLLNLNGVIRSKDRFLDELKKIKLPIHTLVFCEKETDWKLDFEKKGGLFFTKHNYLIELGNILKIERTIPFIELKKQFVWSDIRNITSLPADKVLMCDNYIIINENKRKNNLYPILKILNLFGIENFEFELFTTESAKGNDFGAKWDLEKEDLVEEVNGFIEEESLDLQFNLRCHTKRNSKFDFHDRRMYLRYIMVLVGKGFDLLPYNAEKINDKKITISTILNKSTYDDFRYYYSKFT